MNPQFLVIFNSREVRMVGIDHGPAESSEERSPELQARHARLGLGLFAVYFVLYAIFMGLAAFAPARLAARPLGGVNLALVYGFGLIATAIILAFLYGWLCRSSGPAEVTREERS
jgi:uncharacterized membrane protein (DUF485 family)